MGEKDAALLPLPLPVTSKKNKDSPFPLESVEEVLKWALHAAVRVAVAMVLAKIPIACILVSKIFQCSSNLTPGQATDVDFFGEGFLWCTVPQAVAATVELLLPSSRARSRWSLALVAVVSAIAAHYMLVRVFLLFVAADPGDVGLRVLMDVTSVVMVAADVFRLVSLLVGGAE